MRTVPTSLTGGAARARYGERGCGRAGRVAYLAGKSHARVIPRWLLFSAGCSFGPSGFSASRAWALPRGTELCAGVGRRWRQAWDALFSYPMPPVHLPRQHHCPVLPRGRRCRLAREACCLALPFCASSLFSCFYATSCAKRARRRWAAREGGKEGKRGGGVKEGKARRRRATRVYLLGLARDLCAALRLARLWRPCACCAFCSYGGALRRCFSPLQYRCFSSL